MRLKRYIGILELQELLKKGKVVPKRQKLYFDNSKEDYEISINLLRSNLDDDNNGLFTPSGYCFSDVKQISYRGKVLDLKKIKEKYGLL